MADPSPRLRNRRKAKNSNTDNDGEEDDPAIEMSGTSTIAVVFFLMFVGAAMASAYILSKNPGCFRASKVESSSTSSLRSPAAVETSKINTSPAAAPVATVKAGAPAPEGFPAACTVEQMTLLKKHLSSGACESSPPWLQTCSFTQATTKGCRDTTAYLRTPLAAMSLTTDFQVVLMGLAGAFDEEPMDYLALGHHDYTKYSLTNWRKASGQTDCPLADIPFQGNKPPNAHVHIVEKNPNEVTKVQKWITDSGVSNADGITVEAAVLDGPAKVSLSQWVQGKIPNDPIHVLRLNGVGPAGDNLRTAKDLLSRVWYLEFDYSWQGGWGSTSLNTLINTILEKEVGMVCYWKGTRGHLWRISNCWQNHYDQKHWSYVACANTKIPETKPIRDKMEEVFLETLKKPISY